MLPLQCKMARAALNLTPADLAKRTAISSESIERFEQGDDLDERAIAALQTELEQAGVEFTGDSYGTCVRLRSGANTSGGKTTSGPKTIPLEKLSAENDE